VLKPSMYTSLEVMTINKHKQAQSRLIKGIKALKLMVVHLLEMEN